MPILSIKDKPKIWPNLQSILCKVNFLYSYFEVRLPNRILHRFEPITSKFPFKSSRKLDLYMLLIFVKISYNTDENNRIYSI